MSTATPRYEIADYLTPEGVKCAVEVAYTNTKEAGKDTFFPDRVMPRWRKEPRDEDGEYCPLGLALGCMGLIVEPTPDEEQAAVALTAHALDRSADWNEGSIDRYSIEESEGALRLYERIEACVYRFVEDFDKGAIADLRAALGAS